MKYLLIITLLCLAFNLKGQNKADTVKVIKLTDSLISYSGQNLFSVTTLTGTSTIMTDAPRKDDFFVNGIRVHHQANCSNCDVVTAMSIAGYNYRNGVFYRRDQPIIIHRKIKKKKLKTSKK